MSKAHQNAVNDLAQLAMSGIRRDQALEAMKIAARIYFYQKPWDLDASIWVSNSPSTREAIAETAKSQAKTQDPRFYQGFIDASKGLGSKPKSPRTSYAQGWLAYDLVCVQSHRLAGITGQTKAR